MQTTNLVMGLVSLVAAVCFAWMGFTADNIGLIVLYTLAGAVHGAWGVNEVLESLFGDDGLICPLFGKIGDEDE